MASDSHLSRYQPAILAVVAAAAGYGIYRFYATSPQESASLHRSNAVHRPRRDRATPGIDHVHSTPDLPMGRIVMRRNRGERYNINLGIDRLPSVQDLMQLQSVSNPAYVRDELEDAALSLILSACLVASHRVETWQRLENYGLRELLDAMASRDEQQVRRLSHDIPRLVNLGNIDWDKVEQAVTTFFGSQNWREGLEMQSEDPLEPAETDNMEMLNGNEREPSQGIRGLLYYIAEEDAKRKAYEHRGINCEECGEQPIRGVRWHCLNCPDFDLCSSCEMGTQHPKTHVFAKIKVPLPVLSQPSQEIQLWYPGDPQKIHKSLDAALKKKLCEQHEFEEPQLDAFHDQFICIANVPNPDQSASVEGAIDRRAFNKAMTCDKWPKRFAANAMYDRMFFFYDTDGNGLIDFEEFVSGLAYLRGPKRYASLTRTISGYDIDGDGYVDRSDFLRLLTAKYDIQKQLVDDMIRGQETEYSQSAAEVLRGSQPISSIFAQEDIPRGEIRRPRGKRVDAYGDMQPLDGTKTVLDDNDTWPTRRARGPSMARPAHERMERHLSRFEELLHSPEGRTSRNGALSPRTPEMVDFGEGLVDIRSTDDHIDPDVENEEIVDDEIRRIVNDSPYVDLEEDDFELDHSIREPHMEDILWQVTQAALNDLLDRIFMGREKQDEEAASTSRDRARWRLEIDAAKKAHDEQVAAEAADPLIATAKSAEPRHQASMTQRAVPTDWPSLERREREISEASLDELFDSFGAGVRDDDSSSPRAAHIGSSSIWNGRHSTAARSGLRNSVSISDISDEPQTVPTLPQNRPTTDSPDPKRQTSLRRSRGRSIDYELGGTKPNQARLLYLAQMDEVEREMEERGGPGRLSYDEIEMMAVNDKTGEVRGLVKNWLEWASF